MRIALITGASSGIGSWFALYTAVYRRHIDQLWLVGRSDRRLRAVAKKVTKRSGIPCRLLPADLSKEQELESIEKILAQAEPEICLLINSAGYGMMGEFKRISRQELAGMVRLNCEALTSLISICIPYMPHKSKIINVASAAAFMPQSEFAVYAATKSYVLSLSRALRKELKPREITVTAVCPGCIDTPFFKRAEKYQKMKPYKKKFMARPQAVVQKAMLDADQGKVVSVYGLPMQLLYLASKLLPDSILRLFY